MHRQIRRVCIIERSKWVQDEHHGSLIVNVITVSGKTRSLGRGEIIEMVKSERLPCLLSTNCYCLVKLMTKADGQVLCYHVNWSHWYFTIPSSAVFSCAWLCRFEEFLETLIFSQPHFWGNILLNHGQDFQQSPNRGEKEGALFWDPLRKWAEWRSHTMCADWITPTVWHADSLNGTASSRNTDDWFGSTWTQITVRPPCGVPTMNEQMLPPLPLFSCRLPSFSYICCRVMDDKEAGYSFFSPDMPGTIRIHFLPICLIGAIAYESSLSVICSLPEHWESPMMDLSLIRRC